MRRVPLQKVPQSPQRPGVQQEEPGPFLPLPVLDVVGEEVELGASVPVGQAGGVIAGIPGQEGVVLVDFGGEEVELAFRHHLGVDDSKRGLGTDVRLEAGCGGVVES